MSVSWDEGKIAWLLLGDLTFFFAFVVMIFAHMSQIIVLRHVYIVEESFFPEKNG